MTIRNWNTDGLNRADKKQPWINLLKVNYKDVTNG